MATPPTRDDRAGFIVPSNVSRRGLLWGTGGLVVASALPAGLLGCRTASEGRYDAVPVGGASARDVHGAPPPSATVVDARDPMPYGAPPARPSADVPAGCRQTHDNIEGPYYRKGAPERFDLTDRGMEGTPLEITGKVTGLDCARGLAGVELDLWQANHAGHYDNDGSMGAPGARFLLRGRVRTDGDGRYKVKTIVPGRYLNGPQYRPAHVHVKVRAAGHAVLTTQLYFPDDPFNEVDGFIHRSLIMDVEKVAGAARAHFDFALRPG